MKNIITSNLVNAFKKMWQHKLVFVLLVVVQVIFLIAVMFSQFSYQTKILGDTQDIMNYLEKINNQPSQEGLIPDLLGDDPLLITSKYSEIKTLIYYMLGVFFLLYLVINGFNWTLTNHMFSGKESIKELFSYLLRFIAMSIVFFIPLIVFIVLIISSNFFSFLDLGFLKIIGTLLIFLLLVSVYFVQIGYYFIGRENVLKKKGLIKVIKKAFNTGIYRSGVVGFGFLINLVILAIVCSLLFYFVSMEPGFVVWLGLVVLVVFCFIYTRIFFYGLIDGLSRRKV